MLIIGIESSALVASVAVVRDSVLVAEYTVCNTKTHSQTLMPMLDEVVKSSGIELDEVDAIAISRGPGSFTGLRIGSATAKGLGLALNKPLVEVPTLDALAYNLAGCGDAVIVPIMDARRQEVYSGIYEEILSGAGDTANKTTKYPLNIIEEECAGPLTDVLDRVNALGRRAVFLGDGVPVYKDVINEKLKVPYSFAPDHLLRQKASSVAMLGSVMFEEGRTVSAGEHAPTYLRVSQAEREKQ